MTFHLDVDVDVVSATRELEHHHHDKDVDVISFSTNVPRRASGSISPLVGLVATNFRFVKNVVNCSSLVTVPDDGRMLRCLSVSTAYENVFFEFSRL